MGKENKIVYGENNTRLYYKLVAEVETRSIMRRSIGLLYYYYYYHYNPLTRSLVIIGRLYESREKQRKREWRQKIDKQNMNKFQGFSCYYFNVIIGLSRGERRRQRGVKILRTSSITISMSNDRLNSLVPMVVGLTRRHCQSVEK